MKNAKEGQDVMNCFKDQPEWFTFFADIGRYKGYKPNL